MTRSRRKSPWSGLCANSEKFDKRVNNRVLRRAVKKAMQRGDEVMPLMREVSNAYDMHKDGKQYLKPGTEWGEKGMRK